MNKKKFREVYKGFEITNTWNGDWYVVINYNERFFQDAIQHAVGFKHCGNHHKLESAKSDIDKMVVSQCIKEVSEGEYGLWTGAAKVAIESKLEDQIISELRDQYNNMVSRGSIEKMFTKEIINVLKQK